MTHDVVLYISAVGRAPGAGEVLLHTQVGDERWTCIAVWVVLHEDDARDGSRYIKCKVREDGTRLIPTSMLIDIVIHSDANVGEVSTLLIPPSLCLGSARDHLAADECNDTCW